MKKQPTITDLMEFMRADGWCVVLKCLPKEVGWLIEGARTEAQLTGYGKWLAQAKDMKAGNYRGDFDALDENPLKAMKRVWMQVSHASEVARLQALPDYGEAMLKK